jgi:CRP/FNR family transcriptional regulator, cyclic AMP receptor protein
MEANDMQTTVDLLRDHPFLEGLTDRQLERLSYHASRSMFHAGNRVFSEGDPADRFWLIARGRVNLEAQSLDGHVVVETLGPGAVLGWSWLFPPYRWHFGAVAVETALTVSLDAAAVRRLGEQDHDVGYELASRFMRVMLDRLQATRMRMLDLHHRLNG